MCIDRDLFAFLHKLVAHRRAVHTHHSLIITIRQHHIKMDFYRDHRRRFKRSLSILVEVNRLILVGQEWDLELLDLHPIVENRRPTVEVHITLTTSEIQVVCTSTRKYVKKI